MLCSKQTGMCHWVSSQMESKSWRIRLVCLKSWISRCFRFAFNRCFTIVSKYLFSESQFHRILCRNSDGRMAENRSAIFVELLGFAYIRLFAIHFDVQIRWHLFGFGCGGSAKFGNVAVEFCWGRKCEFCSHWSIWFSTGRYWTWNCWTLHQVIIQFFYPPLFTCVHM